MNDYAVTGCRLHQRAAQRGHPTDVVAAEIDLVGAYDAYHSLRSRGVGIAHGRAEEDLLRRPAASSGFGVNHFRGVDSLREIANPAIDLAQAPFVVLVIGVLAAIAVACRPRNHFGHRRAFSGEQKSMLVSESLQTTRRDVILGRCALGARLVLREGRRQLLQNFTKMTCCKDVSFARLFA